MSVAIVESGLIRRLLKETTLRAETPSQKYETFYNSLDNYGLINFPKVYLPTSITSGGYKWLEKNLSKPDMGVVKEKNVALANTFHNILAESEKDFSGGGGRTSYLFFHLI